MLRLHYGIISEKIISVLLKIADAIAPGLMFAYGWGRVGCQVAGDGDWGIINSAFVSDANGGVQLANTSRCLYKNVDRKCRLLCKPIWFT